MNTISVIVPIYNAEKYLAKCIESLIHQSHTALQIILINDGSTDQSWTIAEQYAQQDSRIQVYAHPTNQGQSAARNLGLLHASGEFISFVDADDYVDTDFYVGDIVSVIGPSHTNSMGFKCRFYGKSAHAANHHKGHDAVMMAVQAITAMQNMVCREVNPLKPTSKKD